MTAEPITLKDAQAPTGGLLESRCIRQRVAILFNPVSGTVSADLRREIIERLARDAGLSCELALTDKGRGAGPLAEAAVQDQVERVLVSGGDGSVTEAADVLAGTGVELGVLPGGTGNLLALNLGIPSDGEEAMKLALRAPALPVDVGRANGHVFLIMAGMGADGRMIRDADREAKQKLGVLAYFIAACRNLGRKPITYTITVDGRRFRRRALTTIVANLGKITGGIELVPGCNPHDGLLEVAILRARGAPELLKLAVQSVLKRERDESLLEVHRGRQIVIETSMPQPVELDGNEADATNRLEIKVEPGALQLVCPTCDYPAAAEAGRNYRGTLIAVSALGVTLAAGATFLLSRRYHRTHR